MWWVWPHLRRLWAAIGAVMVGLTVSYLYSLSSKQALPDFHIVSTFFHSYWPWFGGALVALAVVSVFAEEAHRRHGAPHFIGETGRRKGARARLPRRPASLPTASPTVSPTASPTAAPLMVGREDELAQLRDWYASVLQGERRVVFVSGEAGIGKTTFVNKFIDSLRREGVRVARGQCVEQYGADEPYMPMLEALTQLGRGAESRPLLATLHRLAPAWLAQLPALLTAEERVRIQGETQGLTQQRMLREMAEALAALATDAPLVLLLEDLHWSDASTLDLIAAIARRTETARLLMLGTYRPVAMLAGDHPLRALQEELELHGHCQELRLRLLSEADVGDYLTRRFSQGTDSSRASLILTQLADSGLRPRLADSPAPRARSAQERFASVAPAIYARTDGNALFMVNVVDYLVAQGPSLDASKIATPRNIRQMIEHNLRRLDAEEQTVLESASVAGAEFSAAAVAAALERPVSEIEGCCARLSRNEQFIRAQGTAEWPDATVAGSYAFLHSLYRDVLYERTSPGQRIELHRRSAARQEAAWGDRVAEIAAELAYHYGRGGNKTKALKYLELAGEQAVARRAYREAERHYREALALLHTFPESAERDAQEATLKAALADAESFQVYEGMYFFGDLAGARKRFLREIEEARDESSVNAWIFAACNEWYLGYPDRALRYAEEALSMARRQNNPEAMAFVLSVGSYVYELRGEFQRAREAGDEGARLSAACGFPLWNGLAKVRVAYARAQMGETAGAAEEIRTMLAFGDDVGFKAGQAAGLGFLCEAQALAGDIDEALVTVEQALHANPEELLWRPNLYRLRSEFKLRKGAGDQAHFDAVESDLRQAIKLAREMNAKSAELRATTSLARLLDQTGRRDAARAMLSEIYDWFTEGFDTLALREAKAVLDALNNRPATENNPPQGYKGHSA